MWLQWAPTVILKSHHEIASLRLQRRLSDSCHCGEPKATWQSQPASINHSSSYRIGVYFREPLQERDSSMRYLWRRLKKGAIAMSRFVHSAVFVYALWLLSLCPTFAKVSSTDPAIHAGVFPRGALYALVVGVSRYKDQGLPPLRVADQDAKAFGDFLKTQDRLFQEAHITYLLNEKATKAEIEKYLYYTLPKAGKDDTVVLFLSGHGRFDPMRPKEFFFLPYDAENEYIAATGVKMSGLDFLNGVNAEKVLLIADACHAGGFSQMKPKASIPSLELFLKEAKNSSGKAIITSSKDGQLSWELPGQANSVFTYHLLEGLKGKADRDHDGLVTLNEAYEYAYARTKEETKGHQHPQFEGSVVGTFPLSFVGAALSEEQLNAKLLASAKDGNVQEANAALACRADVNVRDEQNATPLIIAASTGRPEVVKLLLEKGADVNATDNNRRGALSGASAIGQLEVVEMLLNAGAKVDQKDFEGWTPLAHASSQGHATVVQALIAHGADVRTRTKTGDTPLSLAASQGHIKAVELLIGAGADVNAVDLQGVSPLIKALRRGHGDSAQLLLSRGATLKTRNASTEDVMLFTAAIKADVNELKRLLKHGAHVDSETDAGDTPFTLAASLGHLDVMKALAQKGANIDFKGPEGRTALMAASSQGNTGVVSFLLKLGTNSNVQDNHGDTALLLGIRNKRPDVVKLLIAHKADVNMSDEQGKTPLMAAAESGQEDVVRLLLAKGAAVDAKDKSGSTALMLAAQQGNVDITKLLIKKNAAIDAQDVEGRTALMKAVYNGRKDVVRVLMAAGADPTAKDWEGKTSLARAIEAGHDELVELLRR